MGWIAHASTPFRVAVDPEFPGDGDWRCPTYAFDRDGTVRVDPDTTWGAPTVLDVTPNEEDRWIGFFSSGGLGGLSGVFATPDAVAVCVVVDGLAYLVDVTAPQGGAPTISWQTAQVVPMTDPRLLLIVSDLNIVALGVDGVAWQTQRLAVDDLRVVKTAPGRILCTLDNLGGSATIELDATTGEQVSGTRLDSFWPPNAQ